MGRDGVGVYEGAVYNIYVANPSDGRWGWGGVGALCVNKFTWFIYARYDVTNTRLHFWF